MLKFDLNDIPVIWRWQWEDQAHFDFISLLAAVFIAVVGLLGVLIFIRRERSALWPSLSWSIAMGCVFLILFRSYDDPRSIKRAPEGVRLYPAYSALLSQLPEIVEPDDAVIFTDRRFEFYLLDMDKAFASRYVVAKDNQPIILETVPKLLQEVPEDGRIWLVADDLDNRLLAYSVELWLKERAHISERYLFGQSVRLIAFNPILKPPWGPISAKPELDRVVEPKEHTYKGIAALLGWDWSDIEVTELPVLEAGKSHNFNLFWVYGGMSMDDTLYVRLLNEEGRVVVEALSSAKHDSPLIPGQLLKDSITVSLPHSLPRGSYHLQIGFFTRAVEAGELNFSLPGEMTEVQVR
jgi:hypothetical protein